LLELPDAGVPAQQHARPNHPGPDRECGGCRVEGDCQPRFRSAIAAAPAGSREEISDAYDLLMGLRLETQTADIRAGREPSSVVELSA